MSRVRIDFAPAARWRVGRVALAVGLVVLVAAGLSLRTAAQRDAQLHALEQRLASRTVPAVVPAPAPPSLTPDQRGAANDAITLLNLPWPALLDGLSAARPENVALLRLEPRASQRLLRVVAESEQASSLFDFVETLAHQPPFVRLTPVSQERLDAPARVRMTLDLEWRR